MLEASNQTKNNKKRANYSSRAAGEVLSHFPSTIRFIFRSKIFPKNDAQTQKHSSVQDTQWSLSSIPSIKVQSFWKYFCIFLQFAFQNAFSFFFDPLLFCISFVSLQYLFDIRSVPVPFTFSYPFCIHSVLVPVSVPCQVSSELTVRISFLLNVF